MGIGSIVPPGFKEELKKLFPPIEKKKFPIGLVVGGLGIVALAYFFWKNKGK